MAVSFGARIVGIKRRAKGEGDLRNWDRNWQRKKDLLAALEQHCRQCSLLEHLLLSGLNLARAQQGHEHDSEHEKCGQNSEVLHFCVSGVCRLS